jgi:hypothetical protein
MAVLDYELNIINSMGFTDYFLIVWDYVAMLNALKYRARQRLLAGTSSVFAQ